MARPIAGGRRRLLHDRRAVVLRLTVRGIGALVVVAATLAFAVAASSDELLPIAVGGAVLLATAPVSACRRVRRARAGVVVGARVAPMTVPVGSGAHVALTVRNRAGGRCPSLAIEATTGRWISRSIGANHAGAEPGPRAGGRRLVARAVAPGPLVALPTPRPGTTEVLTIAAPTARRGLWELPASPVWALDALGLCAASGSTIPALTVVVHPRGTPDVSWPRAASPGSVDWSGDADVPEGDGTGDLVGLRPYVVGDRLSLVHWPSRARHGAWFVRQFAPETGAPERLVIDDRAGVHRRADFEAVLSTAQGLVDAAMSEDRPIVLCTLSGRAWYLTGERRSYEELVAVIASLRPRHGVPATGAGGVVLTTTTGAGTLPGGTTLLAVGR